MIKYDLPDQWMKYDKLSIVDTLLTAKAAVLSLTNIPFHKDWVEKLQQIQLKREVAGTSRIEGAEFTDRELDVALSETAGQKLNRSQKQAAAAKRTYKWIATVPLDRPISEELICEIHTMIVTGCDDDRCEPGRVRRDGHNVTFGFPPHRGANGGAEAENAFRELNRALREEYRAHDPLIQALAVHYHFAAMHPFGDGNGRTARALESMMLQRIGLNDSLFIAMSNYYHDEKTGYLESLSAVRAGSYDLTPFLLFGLKGVEEQCNKLFEEIKRNVSKTLYEKVMRDLFFRLENKRKRVIAERQVKILELLLEKEDCDLTLLLMEKIGLYKNLENPLKALVRDLNHLIELGAIWAEKTEPGYKIHIRLEWPTQITETVFFKKVKDMPKAKTAGALRV